MSIIVNRQLVLVASIVADAIAEADCPAVAARVAVKLTHTLLPIVEQHTGGLIAAIHIASAVASAIDDESSDDIACAAQVAVGVISAILDAASDD